jgi:O-antigen ligase
MIVPVAAGMMMDEAGAVLSRSRQSSVSAFAFHGPEPFARLLLKAFVVGVMVAAIVLCASRGAVLALGAATLFYGGTLALRGRVGRGEAAVALTLLALAAGLSVWLGVGPLAQKLHAFSAVENEPSLLSRIVGWESTLKIVASHPLLGTGLGTFSEAWGRFYPPGTSYSWHEAHNDYLQLSSETGIAGMTLFAAALAIFVWRYVRPGLIARGLTDSYAIHGVVVGIFAVALHSIVDFPLQINACAVLLVVMAGLLVAYRRRQEARA